MDIRFTIHKLSEHRPKLSAHLGVIPDTKQFTSHVLLQMNWRIQQYHVFRSTPVYLAVTLVVLLEESVVNVRVNVRGRSDPVSPSIVVTSIIQSQVLIKLGGGGGPGVSIPLLAHDVGFFNIWLKAGPPGPLFCVFT